MPIVALLVLADIGWRFWAWTHPQAVCSTTTSITGRPFMLMADHRSNVDAISIRKDKTWEAVYVEMDLNNDRQPDQVLHYFNGKDVFNVNLQPGQPPKFDVYFYGPGKSVTWWLDRGGAGAFTDRIFYDTTGNLTRHEVLLGPTWRALEKRAQQNGVVIDGQWTPVQLTNGNWATDKRSP